MSVTGVPVVSCGANWIVPYRVATGCAGIRSGILLAALFTALAGAMTVGCATHADSLAQIRQAYYAGQLDRARSLIDRQLRREGPDSDVLRLERAMVELAAGQPKQAEQTLRQVRDRFEYLEQKSAAEAAAAVVSDDQALAYAGEDYEKVLIRAFLALANLMADGGDALAYSLQVTEKQNQIILGGTDPSGHNPKLAYRRVAFGAYLHGVLMEASHLHYDDAARAWAKVLSWQPQFPYGPDDLQRARYGRHSAPGNGVVYVFALVGRGPYKQEALEEPSRAALLIADRILSYTGKHTLPPTVAPVKVPQVVLWPNRIRRVLVSVDGHGAGQTETVTDVGRLAVQQYAAIYDQVVARAVVRRIVKKALIYGAKEALNVDRHSVASVLLDMGGVVWEATESADTRCWGLLPDKIQVVRLELPAGHHRIGLQAAGEAGPIGPSHSATINVLDGRNTYLLAIIPDSRAVGQILVNTP